MPITRYKNIILKCTDFMGKCLNNKKSAVAYVGGWFGKQNLGDEASFMAVKKIFTKFNFIYFDDSRTLTALIKMFPLMKGGILAGGTLINIGTWYDTAKHYYELCPNLSVFGTGVASPSFWTGRPSYVNTLDKWETLLEKCQYVGVRGPMSADLLIEAGLKNVEVIGDPTLTFADNEINHLYEFNSLGLNIGTSRGNVWGNEDTIYSEYVKLARFAREAKWMVKWFVVWPGDLEITQRVANASNTSAFIYKIYDDPQMYLDLVRPVSIFVGMKLHATILATCAYIPSIMLEYRPKCRDYMKSIGQDDATFKTDAFNATQIWEIVRTWNSRRHEKAKILFNSIKTLRSKQDLRAAELMSKMV